jgi:hypothetical protein
MKNLKYIIGIMFVAVFMGCESENDDTSFATDAAAPQNVTALFTIAQDNSGLVTIAPHGEGVTSFRVYYGDNDIFPGEINAGEKVNHTYAEGQYNVIIKAYGINGKSTEVTLPLTVSFIAPANLDVTVATVVGNPFKVNVTATADYETYFEATFGEDASLPPVQFNEGQTASYTYAAIGTYTVTVTAFSGGVATTTYTEEVTISNPLNLPITFESGTFNFGNFGNATSTVVANPDPTGINTSATVAKQVKNAGSETWAGSLLTLDTPITNLGTMKFIKMKVWSPAVGTNFLIKLENLADNTINFEVPAVTTVANQWEELTYNFGGANANQTYNNIVVFCNFNVVGAGDTYYFDDITQSATAGGAGGINLPLNFEVDQDYTWNNFGGAIGTRSANPDATGINTSGFVGKFVKNPGETWAGVAVPLDAPIDFGTMQKVKVKVWSPQANIPIILKFENIPHVTNQDIERSVNTTVANQWEEITFDFTGIVNANNYQQLVIFFNFGTAGAGQAYYFDDVKLSN